MSKSRAGEVSGGLFLIGIAILFLTGWWWPGILFVVGTVVIVSGFLEGKSSDQIKGGFVPIVLGIIFTIGFNVGLLLLCIGLMVLVGALSKSDKEQDVMAEWSEKPKHKNGGLA